MRGIILLSEGRSGTNWLGSMLSATDQLGKMSEWLGAELLGKDIEQFSEAEFFAEVMQRGATDNGRFAIKIFPRHLQLVNTHLGFDFIKKCVQEYEIKLLMLTRQDVLAQAVSFVRGIQSRQWTSKNRKQGSESYDFDALCRAYFYISRSNHYWDSYLSINQYECERFVYEDLLPDPTPFLDCVTSALDVDQEFEWKSDLKVQRDAMSQEWSQRFRADINSREIVGFSGKIEAFGSFSLPRRPASVRDFLARKFGLFS